MPMESCFASNYFLSDSCSPQSEVLWSLPAPHSMLCLTTHGPEAMQPGDPSLKPLKPGAKPSNWLLRCLMFTTRSSHTTRFLFLRVFCVFRTEGNIPKLTRGWHFSACSKHEMTGSQSIPFPRNPFLHSHSFCNSRNTEGITESSALKPCTPLHRKADHGNHSHSTLLKNRD